MSVYPDSGKVGVVVGAAPGGPEEKRTLSGLFRQEDGVDYYEGEGVAGGVGRGEGGRRAAAEAAGPGLPRYGFAVVRLPARAVG